MRMTDEQVKKVLENCSTWRYEKGGCKQCAYCDDCDHGTGNYLFSDALALINRLEQKNKTLLDKNKELRELCRKKSNGMNIKDWVRMTQEANWGIKLVDKQEEIKLIRKEVLREIYDWMMENAVYYEGESFAKKFAKEHGLEVEI